MKKLFFCLSVLTSVCAYAVPSSEELLGKQLYIENCQNAEEMIAELESTTKDARLKNLLAKLYVAHQEKRSKDVLVCLFAIDYLLNEATEE